MAVNGMRQGPVRLVTTVLGIVFRQRSPERLVYSRRRLFICLGLAITISYLAHVAYWLQSTPHALLWIVLALGVLVIGVRQLPASRRFRVVRMLLALFLISALGDVALVGAGFLSLPPNVRVMVGYVVVAVQIAGATNCVRYGLETRWHLALGWTIGFVIVVLVLYELIAPLLDPFV